MNHEEAKKGFFTTCYTPEEVEQYALEHADNTNKYVAWIDIYDNEVYQRLWAFKRTKKKGFQMTEVERRKADDSKWAAQKNMWFCGLAGWRVVYEQPEDDIQTYGWGGYGYWASTYNKWGMEKTLGVSYKVLNTDIIFTLDKYKYCGYSGGQDVIDYLCEYKKNPKVEFFGKLGLRTSPMLMKACEKDKQLIRFLKDHVHETNIYGPQTTMFAYKHKLSFSVAREMLDYRKRALYETRCLMELNSNVRERIYKYIGDNGIGIRNYLDYFRAIRALDYDLKDTKNLFPKDFDRMHDLRTQEYASFMEKKEKEKRRALNKRIRTVAETYEPYLASDGDFEMKLPVCVRDFIHEGSKLHHCVGRMGYDKKMADKKSLIVFVRKTDSPEEPYVTVEYLLKDKKVAQCYADHDSKPEKDVQSFVDAWAKQFTKQLKKEAVN